MLAGLLSATPIEKPNSRDLDLRSATSWTNPKGGNVNIKFSEQKVSYGTKKPSDAVGEVGLKCDGDACLPSFTITTVGCKHYHTTRPWQLAWPVVSSFFSSSFFFYFEVFVYFGH